MCDTHYSPVSLVDAVRYFSDPTICESYMVRMKWPDGVIRCPKCGGDNVGAIKSRRKYQCRENGCRRQFSSKVDTIFEDSPLGLDKWFVAVWSIANCKNGISSCELARALKVTQKTAWFMLHRVRCAMKTRSFRKIIGEIEADESFVGGHREFQHKNKRSTYGRGPVGKAIIQGLLERGGEVRAMVVADQRKRTLQGNVRANVTPGASVYSDTLASYVGLDAEYVHKMIDHTICYVLGRVHTNGLENFWSLLKRSLDGTYIAVAPEHLQRYVDAQVFRFNKRKGNDATRFLEVMLSTPGKRLTWKALTSS
jgi:transposase-like protein